MTTRHPTEKKMTKPTYRPPMISCGTKERTLLWHLKKIKGRFNLRRYSIVNNIPRTTLYDQLNRLQDKGLIKKEGLGNYVITTQGLSFVDMTSGKVELGVVGMSDSPRKVCREVSDKLSSHFIRFSLPITNKQHFTDKNIDYLNPIKWKKVDLPNLPIYYLYFEDATILIKPKRVEIQLKELLNEDVNESYFESFSKAISYVEKIEKIGIIGENLILEQGHYARVESILADVLQKIDDRFFLELGNGKKFWIDTSLGKLEDETNDPEAREKLDNNLREMMRSDASFKDIDKVIEALGLLTKLRILDSTDLLRKPIEREKEELRYNYFG